MGWAPECARQIASAFATFLIRWRQLQGTEGCQQEHPLVYTSYSFGLTTLTMLAYSALWRDWEWVEEGKWGDLSPYLLWIGVTGLLTQLAVVQGLTMSTVGRATAMRYLSVRPTPFATLPPFSVINVLFVFDV